MTIDPSRVRAAIESEIRTESNLTDAVARDVAFHLTDWLDDLKRFHDFCEAPDGLSSKDLDELLVRFMTHVPNHLAAASKLFLRLPVTDIFEVGATKEDDEPEF